MMWVGGSKCSLPAIGPFAKPRDAAQRVEEEKHPHPNLRKGDYQEKEKRVA